MFQRWVSSWNEVLGCCCRVEVIGLDWSTTGDSVIVARAVYASSTAKKRRGFCVRFPDFCPAWGDIADHNSELCETMSGKLLMPWFVDELVSDEMLPLEVAFSKSEDPLLKCKSWSCYASTLMSLCMQTSWKPARATSTRRQSFRRAGVGSSSRRLRPCSTPQNSNMGKRVSGRNSNDARKRRRATPPKLVGLYVNAVQALLC
jgi:hypothetical protein